MGGGKLPRYSFTCTKCFKSEERILSMENADKLQVCQCGCQMRRNFQADVPNISGGDYHRAIHSDALAINPSQRAEHERLFPDIKLDDECRPVFDNFSRHEKYLKETGFKKIPQRIRRKFTFKIGGKKNRKKEKAKIKG